METSKAKEANVEIRYVCGGCRYVFLTLIEYQEHICILNVPFDLMARFCDVCGASFKNIHEKRTHTCDFTLELSPAMKKVLEDMLNSS